MKYIQKISGLKYSKITSSTQDVELNDIGQVKLSNRTAPEYKREFVPYISHALMDDSVSHKIVVGPFGSGKTSAIVNAILDETAMMPMCDDGIRRCKWAIVRNTAGQLETTTMATWLFWTEGLPQPYRKTKPQLTLTYRFHDQLGLIILDVLFLALDRVDDVRKLESLELSHVYINEGRHIPKTIYDVLLGRIGRYPPKISFLKQFDEAHKKLNKKDRDKAFQDWQPFKKKSLVDTNPPKNRHWIAEADKNSDSGIKVYHQPPALLKVGDKWIANENADNIAFVGSQYYLDMLGRGEEYVSVYALGRYGTIVDGKPVYPCYNDDLHSVDDIPINTNEPIYIGIDLGLVCPAVVISQIIAGQIRDVKEFIGDYISIKTLFESTVKPFLNRYCKGLAIISTHDPADTAQGSEQLRECGVESERCWTNKVENRLVAQSETFNKLVNGKPFHVISRKGCPTLREGYLGEYCYRRLKVVGEEKYVDQPDKVHPYSDVHDASQYNTIRMCQDLGIEKQIYPHLRSYEDTTRNVYTGY